VLAAVLAVGVLLAAPDGALESLVAETPRCPPDPATTCLGLALHVAQDGTVAYAGAIDDDRAGDRPGEVNYVAAAVGAVLAGEDVATKETRPYGCSVKYAD